MKHIEFKKGNRMITIETPWLRIDEAAAYLGVVRSKFDELRGRIPHGLVDGVVVYSCSNLDRYANHELPDPASAAEAFAPLPRRRQAGGGGVLKNPLNDKVYKSGASGGC
jgi:hypothetical protein